MLTVTDHPTAAAAADPAPLAGTGSGYGLTGLTERAALIGGVLTAGPDTAGWTVRLWLRHERHRSPHAADGDRR